MQYFHMNVARLPKDRENDLIASLMDSRQTILSLPRHADPRHVLLVRRLF